MKVLFLDVDGVLNGHEFDDEVTDDDAEKLIALLLAGELKGTE